MCFFFPIFENRNKSILTLIATIKKNSRGTKNLRYYFLTFHWYQKKYCLLFATLGRLTKHKSSQEVRVIMHYKDIMTISKMEKEVSDLVVDGSKVLCFWVMPMNCSKGDIMNSNKSCLCLISTYATSELLSLWLNGISNSFCLNATVKKVYLFKTCIFNVFCQNFLNVKWFFPWNFKLLTFLGGWSISSNLNFFKDLPTSIVY